MILLGLAWFTNADSAERIIFVLGALVTVLAECWLEISERLKSDQSQAGGGQGPNNRYRAGFD
jgi:hypothetical protein